MSWGCAAVIYLHSALLQREGWSGRPLGMAIYNTIVFKSKITSNVGWKVLSMAKMKICKFPSYLAVVFYTCAVWGFSLQPRQDQTACQPVKLDAKTNVWKNYSLHINPFYRQSVLEAAERVKDETLKKKALKVADVGSFFWLSVIPFFPIHNPTAHCNRNNVTAVSKLERILQSVPCDRIVGLVLQGLQSGNCANPNARPVLLEAYKKDYIDRPSLSFSLSFARSILFRCLETDNSYESVQL